MSKTQKYLFILAAMLLVGAIIILTRLHGRTLAADDPDYVAIQNTLHTYLEIEAEANFSLDDSRLVEVLANDPRGGLFGNDHLNKRLLKSVQWFKDNPNLKVDQIGLLDVRQAFYTFRRQAKQMYDDAITQGRLTAPDLDQILASYDPHEVQGTPEVDLTATATLLLDTLPEYKAMLKAAGYDGVTLPYPRPEKITPPSFTINSISVANDLAHVYGIYMTAPADFTFVKKDGNWFLIGEHISEGHGG